MGKTHRWRRDHLRKMNSFEERFDARFEEEHPKPTKPPTRPYMRQFDGAEKHSHTWEAGRIAETLPYDGWGYGCTVDHAAHEQAEAEWEAEWGDAYRRYWDWRSLRWDAWYRSPERAEQLRMWESSPPIRHPYPRHDVTIGDSYLVNWGGTVEGARRKNLTPNLAREYERTHQAIKEWEDGLINDRGEYVDEEPVEVDFTCMGYLRRCENAVSNRHYRLCKDCTIARDWDIYQYDQYDMYYDDEYGPYDVSWHTIERLNEVAHVLRREDLTQEQFDTAMREAERML